MASSRRRAPLDSGHRHIDTAAAYGNEREVGEAVLTARDGRRVVGTLVVARSA